MSHFSRWTVGAILLAGIVVNTQVNAQAWPDKPVKLIVTQAAGATPDIMARVLAERLSRVIGKQVIVENKPGASNSIGAQAAARSPADGYTFLFATAATLVTNPHTFKTLSYDPVKDFIPVAYIARVPFFVMVNPGIEAKTLSELIALEKKKPGTLSVATDGQRNFSGMLTAWISKLGGVNFTQVPYQSMPIGIQDTLAGRVQVAILAVPSAAPHMAQAKLVAIATSSAQRVPGYDNVPPIADTFPGFDFAGWFALVAPAGTPNAIVQRVNLEIDKILKDAEMRERMEKLGFYTEGARTPEQTATYIKAQYDAWRKVINEIGLQPE
jgi:tripartite-type tricarboxylate transporter receptor subunit TctC